MTKSDIGPIPGKKISAVGISWINEADYAAVLAIMDDPQTFPPTWAEWLVKAEKQEREALRGGHHVIRAVIDPKTFPGWCQTRGLTRIEASARKLWGAEYVARHVGL